MFEHLDDHNPGRAGTGAQLAAVRNRARHITRGRRRSQLAVGSVTLSAAASVSGLAVLTGAGPLRHAGVQAGAGAAAAKPAATKPGLPTSDAERQRKAAGAPGDKAVGPYKSPAPGAASATNPNGGGCDYSPLASSQTPPEGYVVNNDPASKEPASKEPTLPFRRADGKEAQVDLKITCAAIPQEDRTTSDERTVTAIRVAGHDGYLWHAAGEAGVEWTAADTTSVYIKASGADGVRLSDAQLEAYAATLPAT